ncbi:collagen alpha-1(I) chain-like [Hippopotamus amphibius kiboko]|uniref:collagen alpha-1(I) chain-like n=1 Tax=Hippopotamus amphibius kiboko TaxID=575201 RepID=UPI002593B668|nr:collagen alpha-1(I) chain-like [Hippopotamus amphibius kiboko]
MGGSCGHGGPTITHPWISDYLEGSTTVLLKGQLCVTKQEPAKAPETRGMRGTTGLVFKKSRSCEQAQQGDVMGLAPAHCEGVLTVSGTAVLLEKLGSSGWAAGGSRGTTGTSAPSRGRSESTTDRPPNSPPRSLCNTDAHLLSTHSPRAPQALPGSPHTEGRDQTTVQLMEEQKPGTEKRGEGLQERHPTSARPPAGAPQPRAGLRGPPPPPGPSVPAPSRAPAAGPGSAATFARPGASPTEPCGPENAPRPGETGRPAARQLSAGPGPGARGRGGRPGRGPRDGRPRPRPRPAAPLGAHRGGPAARSPLPAAPAPTARQDGPARGASARLRQSRRRPHTHRGRRAAPARVRTTAARADALPFISRGFVCPRAPPAPPPPPPARDAAGRCTPPRAPRGAGRGRGGGAGARRRSARMPVPPRGPAERAARGAEALGMGRSRPAHSPRAGPAPGSAPLEGWAAPAGRALLGAARRCWGRPAAAVFPVPRPSAAVRAHTCWGAEGCGATCTQVRAGARRCARRRPGAAVRGAHLRGSPEPGSPGTAPRVLPRAGSAGRRAACWAHLSPRVRGGAVPPRAPWFAETGDGSAALRGRRGRPFLCSGRRAGASRGGCRPRGPRARAGSLASATEPGRSRLLDAAWHRAGWVFVLKLEVGAVDSKPWPQSKSCRHLLVWPRAARATDGAAGHSSASVASVTSEQVAGAQVGGGLRTPPRTTLDTQASAGSPGGSTRLFETEPLNHSAALTPTGGGPFQARLGLPTLHPSQPSEELGHLRVGSKGTGTLEHEGALGTPGRGGAGFPGRSVATLSSWDDALRAEGCEGGSGERKRNGG